MELAPVSADLWAHPDRVHTLFDILGAEMNTPLYGRINYTSENTYNDVHPLVYPDEIDNWIDHLGYRWDRCQNDIILILSTSIRRQWVGTQRWVKFFLFVYYEFREG